MAQANDIVEIPGFLCAMRSPAAPLNGEGGICIGHAEVIGDRQPRPPPMQKPSITAMVGLGSSEWHHWFHRRLPNRSWLAQLWPGPREIRDVGARAKMPTGARQNHAADTLIPASSR